MKRVAGIVPVHGWDSTAAVDLILLDAHDRHRRRSVFVGEHGATYLLDLPSPVQLHDGDGLMLENGSVVRVAGKPEPLVEVSSASSRELARIAWHIGNRHTEVQFFDDKLRIRRDHVLEDMLRGVGAGLTFLEAPFEPESGAYNDKQGYRHHDHAQSEEQ